MGPSNLGADRGRKDDFAKSLLGCLLHTRCVVVSTSLSHRRKKKRSALALFPNNSLSGTKGPPGTATSCAKTQAAGEHQPAPTAALELLLQGSGHTSSTSGKKVAAGHLPQLAQHPGCHVRGDVGVTALRGSPRSPISAPTDFRSASSTSGLGEDAGV